MEFIKRNLGLLPPAETEDVIEKESIECAARSYLYGLSVGTLTFGIVYFGQKRFTRDIKVGTYQLSCSL